MKRLSLATQFFVYSFLVMLLLLGGVGTFYYQTSSSEISRLIDQKTQDSLQQSNQFISSYLDKLKQTTTSLTQNHLLHRYITTPNEVNKESLLFLMSSVVASDTDLVSAVLVTKQGEVVSTDDKIVMKTSQDMMSEAWYQAAIHQKAMPVLTPVRKEALSKEGEQWVISVTQEIVDSSGQNQGVLRLDIAYKSLEDYLDRLKLGKSGFTFIIDEKQEFVYHPKQSVYSSPEEMSEMKAYLRSEDGKTEGERVLVYQLSIPNSHWTLVGVASLDELHMVQQQMLLTFVVAGLVALLISAIGSALVIRIWLKPIRDLQEVIVAVGNGNSKFRAKEVGTVEVLDLSRYFNQMLDQIDQLMFSIKEQEQNIREYELIALASQINPHFLYNTLDTIIWMTEFNDRERVVALTKALANYFRLALNNGNEQIALKDELEHVKQYLFIQKQRYGEQLQYDFQELPAWDNYQIPKLILQPIVENAIYHGIKEVDRQGMIKIAVSDTEDYLIVSIEDNGKGFDNLTKSDSDEPKMKQGGVGLKNVDQRLRLQFGEAYHMVIASEKDCFTRIELFLPKMAVKNEIIGH